MSNKGAVDQDRYKALFKETDADGNGFISISEFKNLLTKANCNLKDSQIADFFLFFDGPGGDRRLTFEEFSKGLDCIIKFVAQVREIFNRYDKSGDGFLDRNELKQLLGELGGGKTKFTDAEVNKILQDADKNGDNKIALDEFLDAVC